MRFDLVDKVIEATSDRIVTVKNVTSAEEYLADHFPSFPVLPGVMMMEAMVQASRRLLERGGPAGKPWVLAEVRNVRYGNMVRPGQQLRVTVEKIKEDETGVSFKGVGEVEGQTAVQGRFVMRPAKM
ncbi:MAG: 3-hydroxyacyl-ACP dehydratase FabZ family protein [Phycisphaerales bacterium]